MASRFYKAMVVSVPTFMTGVLCYKYHTSISNQFFLVKASEKEMELEQVQFVCRHGARTPTVNISYANDLPNIEEAIWDKDLLLSTIPRVDIDTSVRFYTGEEVTNSLVEQHYIKRGALKGGSLTGQLTTFGQEELHDLGRWLRHEYIIKHGLISPHYMKDEIHVRSSNIKRTLLSAKCLIAGLYGKENLTEPVEIFTKKVYAEDLYPNWGSCKRVKEWANWFNYDDLPGHREDFEKVNKLIGSKEDKPFHFIAVLDFMHCRQRHGMSVPSNLIENEVMILKRASELQAYIVAGKDNQILQASIGSLVNTFCTKMEESENQQRTKLFVYSAHDTTIIGWLIVLGLWNDEWPPFAANLSFELYKNKENKKFVRVLYNEKPMILNKVDSNNEYVPLESFLQLVESYRTKDWSEACGNSKVE